jgi:hypothetical protein
MRVGGRERKERDSGNAFLLQSLVEAAGLAISSASSSSSLTGLYPGP